MLSISAAIDNDRDIFTGISIDCSNLLEEEGATATFECGSIDGSSNSILAILEGSVSSKSKSIENIVPKDPQTIPPDAFPPTLAPVTKPTNPPLEPTVAPRHWQRPKDKDSTPITEEDEGDEDGQPRAGEEREGEGDRAEAEDDEDGLQRRCAGRGDGEDGGARHASDHEDGEDLACALEESVCARTMSACTREASACALEDWGRVRLRFGSRRYGRAAGCPRRRLG